MQSMTPLTKTLIVCQWYYYNTNAHHLRNNPRHACESEDNRNGARARQIKSSQTHWDFTKTKMMKTKVEHQQCAHYSSSFRVSSNKTFMNSHVHIIGISEEDHGNQVWQWESSCMTLRCDWSDYTYSLRSRRGLDLDLEQKPCHYLPQHFIHCFHIRWEDN